MDTSSTSASPPATAASGAVQRALSRWLQPSRLALVIALTFGLALVFLTAPFQAPGEFQHFYRAYQISEGQWAAEYRGNIGGGELPTSLTAVVDPYVRLRFHYEIKTSAREILDSMKVPLNPQQRMFVPFITALYSPVGYLPPAAGIFFGRLLGMTPLEMMYLGRLFNLLCWTVLVYASLRLAPVCRRSLLMLMFMPMSLFLAASLSIDALTNAMALLVAAIILRYATCADSPADDCQMGWGALIALAVATTVLTAAKLAYLPLVGLLLLIPPRRLGGRDRYLTAVAAILALNIVTLLAWEPYTLGLYVKVHDYPNVSPTGQLAYLLAHPAAFATIPVETVKQNFWFILRSFVGRLGWVDTQLSPAFLMLYLAATVAACLPNQGQPAPGRRLPTALIVLACGVASIAAVGVLNYIYWTPLAAKSVSGLQGRYFIPLAPSLIILIWTLFSRGLPRHRWLPDRVGYDALVAAIIVGASVYTLIAVYLRYYGPVIH